MKHGINDTIIIQPEIATQSNLGGREEERENDEGNNEVLVILVYGNERICN